MMMMKTTMWLQDLEVTTFYFEFVLLMMTVMTAEDVISFEPIQHFDSSRLELGVPILLRLRLCDSTNFECLKVCWKRRRVVLEKRLLLHYYCLYHCWEKPMMFFSLPRLWLQELEKRDDVS